MAFGGFDFLQAEKDTSKKVEELAQVLENVATIFLNGVGALEKQLEEMRNCLNRMETQIDTMVRMGGSRAPSAATPSAPKAPTSPAGSPPSPPMPASPGMPPSPGLAVPPPQAPTSPMGAAQSGMGIRAQMQGELQSFLARRRAALEESMREEE
jgi:hypothetical protein